MPNADFGKYRLLAELGHGGMADVFLAVAAGPVGSGFSKLAVIKRLRANLAEDPEFVAMLVDEARIAARLNHPNVVQTNEVGTVGAQYFLAMEYLDGQPLHRIQHRAAAALKKGHDAFPKTLGYLSLIDALAGLHHAHELRDYDGTPLDIVHRDVTPQNVFVTYEGQVKVVDFGIAKAAGRASETQQGIVKGKVRYMAPEQALGQAVDRRADVFSAGIMLWETVVGRRMWTGMDDIQIIHALAKGEVPASPRSVDPSVPEPLDRICVKALAHRFEDRYATAEDFRTDLEQYLADAGLLVEARRRLGPSVAALFADKRVEIRGVIEKQLSALETRPSELELASVSLESPDSAMLMPASSSPPMSIETPNAATSDEGPTMLRSPTSLNRPKRFAVFGAVGLCFAATVAWAVRRPPQPEPVSAATPTKAEATSVNVLLSATPSFSKITLDDRDLGSAFRGQLRRDSQPHRLAVRADGYITKEETVTLDTDLNRDFKLERAPQAAAPGTSPARPQPVPPPPTLGRRTTPTTKTNTAMPTVTTATAEPPPPTPTATSAASSDRRKRPIDKTDPWGNPTKDP